MNKSKAGPMRPATKMRLVGRAARYLEQEAEEYTRAARELAPWKTIEDAKTGMEFGRRAAKLIAAARTLRNLEL